MAHCIPFVTWILNTTKSYLSSLHHEEKDNMPAKKIKKRKETAWINFPENET